MKIQEVAPDARQLDDLEDVLLEVRAGVVALLVRGRNAWHSTWVSHYLRNATLYTNVTSARAGAESKRAQGNVFRVVETPALLLRGASSNAVLCDSYPKNPFEGFAGFGKPAVLSEYGTWKGGLYPGVPIRDAVACFTHDSDHWGDAKQNVNSLRVGLLDAVDKF